MNYLEFINMLNEENEKSYFLIFIKEFDKSTKKIQNVSFINRLFTDIKIAETEIKKLKANDIRNKTNVKSTNDDKILKSYTINQIYKTTTENDLLSFTNKDLNKAKTLYNKIKSIINNIK